MTVSHTREVVSNAPMPNRERAMMAMNPTAPPEIV
jgi:hypothetical protein